MSNKEKLDHAKLESKYTQEDGGYTAHFINWYRKELYNLAIDDAEKVCNEAISITKYTWPKLGQPDVIDYQEAIGYAIKQLKR